MKGVFLFGLGMGVDEMGVDELGVDEMAGNQQRLGGGAWEDLMFW